MIEPQRIRRVDGVFLLDKPVGLSSNAALQKVKRLFRARKAGHTGSLDPLASGLLPICLGAATKVSGILLNADKSYRFVCQLGITTSTGDAEGEVIQTQPVGRIERPVLERALKRLTGDIFQIPPMHSALKHQGQRLYKLARAGAKVERQPRKVTIRNLRVINLDETLLECEVTCSKGTYVRTLAEDIGKALGCGGAHIQSLRRIGVEPYDASQMVTLECIQQRAEQGLGALTAFLLPIDTAIASWPIVQVPMPVMNRLLNGQIIQVPEASVQGWVRLYGGCKNQFLGVGEVLEDARVAPRRLIDTAATIVTCS
jgi:tRNA pseudouridine55 synthase